MRSFLDFAEQLRATTRDLSLTDEHGRGFHAGIEAAIKAAAVLRDGLASHIRNEAGSAEQAARIVEGREAPPPVVALNANFRELTALREENAQLRAQRDELRELIRGALRHG